MIRLMIVALSLVLVVGCLAHGSQPDPPDPGSGFALVFDTEPARHCHDSTQCKADERCYKPNTPIGVCVPKSRKFNSQPDPPDPGFTGCTTNLQCFAHQFCSFSLHICLDKSTSDQFLDAKCLSDSQCPPHQMCWLPVPNRSGLCVNRDSVRKFVANDDEKPCHLESDCPANYHCVASTGKCKEEYVSGICFMDQECQAPEVCLPKFQGLSGGTCGVKDEGRLADGCFVDSQCPDGQMCLKPIPKQSGKCVAKPVRFLVSQDLQKCVLDSECPGDQICVPTDLLPLSPGVCAPKNHGGLCTSDADCKAPQTCSRADDKWGLCLDKSSSSLSPPSSLLTPIFCNWRKKCPWNYNCWQRTCLRKSIDPTESRKLIGDGCFVDSECPAGQMCWKPIPNQSGKCVPKPPFISRHLAAPNPPQRRHCTRNSHCPPKFYCSKANGLGVCKRILVRPLPPPPTRRPRLMIAAPPGDCPLVQCPRGFECRNGMCRQMYPSFADNE